MSDFKHNPVIRFLPSFTDLAFLLPVVFFLARGGGPSMLEGDTGWHIRAGEWMLANGRVPDKDFFSYTKPGEPWFAWEWLWDVIFAWLHQRGGMDAVVLVSLLVISITFAIVFRLARHKSGNVLLAAGFTFLATISSSIHWLARPHLVTLLFTAIFYAVVERAREGRVKLLWLLPVLTVPWTNLHGGFLVGIGLLAAYAAGELTSWLVEADTRIRGQALARGRRYSLVALGCLAASFANPYFYHLHVHISRYLGDPYHWKNINEFLPLSFRHGASPYFVPLFLGGAMTVLWNLRNRRFTDVLLLVSWSYLALLSMRNLPLFAILAVPVIAQAATEWVEALRHVAMRRQVKSVFDWLSETAEEMDAFDRPWRTHAVSVVVYAALVFFFYSASPAAEFRAKYEAKKYPVEALETLAAGIAGARIFTHDEWGDYLIYRLYPAGRVFVDGRSDFYGSEFGEKYMDVLMAKRGWRANLDHFGVNTLLLPVDAQLATAVESAANWQCVYRDKVTAVFRLAKISVAAPDSGRNRDREVAQLKPPGREAVQIK